VPVPPARLLYRQQTTAGLFGAVADPRHHP
jgi:hypothetical protein